MKYTDDKMIDTYDTWQQAQKIPINRGFFVEDLRKVEVAPWDLKGGLGAFVNLDGTGGTNDGYVCEIPPGNRSSRRSIFTRRWSSSSKAMARRQSGRKTARKNTTSNGIREVSSRFRSTPGTSTLTARDMRRSDISP